MRFISEGLFFSLLFFFEINCRSKRLILETYFRYPFRDLFHSMKKKFKLEKVFGIDVLIRRFISSIVSFPVRKRENISMHLKYLLSHLAKLN